MPRTRVLIVDDAVVIRRLLYNILSIDPVLEVVGTAPSGKIGIARIPQVNPDVIILDVEMADMDGLQTLAEIRKTYPTLPVIMFSALTEKGAATTIDALLLGATDYVTKPSNAGSLDGAIQSVRETLLPKIKQFQPLTRGPLGGGGENPAAPDKPFSRGLSGRIDVVAIGVSTGGPNALAEMLPALPGDFPVPIVIVQHMPPIFTKTLAERLNAKCAIRVREAQGGEFLEAGFAWIAPGGYHMVLQKTPEGIQLKLNQEPPENSCRPAVDVTFRSVAEVYGGQCLGVVMTGMGRDGLRGSELIVEQGGQVVVQDEASSVVWAMPQAVVEAGLADQIVRLEELGGVIVHRVKKSRTSAASLSSLE
jgi:two-component system chemotaxis response regulator CheB